MSQTTDLIWDLGWQYGCQYGTIILTGIPSKKIPCYMRDSACMWCIVGSAKIFWSYVKHFWNLPQARNTESKLFYGNKFSSISQSHFLTKTVKQS